MGHVRTQADKTRLIYAVQGLPFVKSTDDSGIIIDEFVWQEINQVLAKNPNWKSISIQSPTAGKFILSGYLQTRSQADQLSEYIAANFPYLDLLEKRITVEEDVVNDANTILTDQGLRDIAIKMSNREITLTGGIPLGKEEALDTSLVEINKIPGVRSVKNLTTKIATAESMINISDRYEVTGVSRQGATYSVVVHGHILTKGDELDGMRIKEISPNAIFLEKDNVQYRIDFSH
jgi:type III secretion system YscD/HrpQ family protein